MSDEKDALTHDYPPQYRRPDTTLSSSPWGYSQPQGPCQVPRSQELPLLSQQQHGNPTRTNPLSILRVIIAVQVLCCILSFLSFLSAISFTKMHWVSFTLYYVDYEEYDYREDIGSFGSGLDGSITSLNVAYILCLLSLLLTLPTLYATVIAERRENGLVLPTSKWVFSFDATIILHFASFFFHLLTFIVALSTSGTKLAYEFEIKRPRPAAGAGLNIPVWLLNFFTCFTLLTLRKYVKKPKASNEQGSVGGSTSTNSNNYNKSEMHVGSNNSSYIQLRERVIQLESVIDELAKYDLIKRTGDLEQRTRELKAPKAGTAHV